MYVIFKKMVETPLIITDLPYDFVVQHRFFHLPSSKIPFDSFQFLDYLKAQVIIAVEIVGDFEGKDIIEKYYKEDKEYLLQKSTQEQLKEKQVIIDKKNEKKQDEEIKEKKNKKQEEEEKRNMKEVVVIKDENIKELMDDFIIED